MTKSKRKKRINHDFKTKGYASIDTYLSDADKGFLFSDSNRKDLLRHCHKNVIIHPGCIKEGDIICLTKMRPKKIRHRKLKFSTWKVQYADIANGFIQLGNSDTFDKEGAEKNVSFIRSHNFPITDVWNLDTAFTLFFLPRLKVYIESTRYGIPSNIYHQYLASGHTEKEAEDLAKTEWENILKRLYEGLTILYEGPDAETIRNRIKKERNLTTQKQLWDVERTMEKDAQELFREHFFSLWD